MMAYRNIEKQKITRRAYYIKNKARIIEYCHKYHVEHREELNQKALVRYHNDRKRQLEVQKLYVKNNIIKVRKYQREYHRKYYEEKIKNGK